MALKQAGVILEVQGFEEFLAKMGEAQTTVQNFGKAMPKAVNGLQQMGTSLTDIDARIASGELVIRQFGKEVTTLGTTADAATTPLQQMGTAAANTATGLGNAAAASANTASMFLNQETATSRLTKAYIDLGASAGDTLSPLEELPVAIGQVIDKEDELKDKTAATSAEAQRFATNATLAGFALTALGAAGAKVISTMGLVASRVEELGVILEVTRRNAINTAQANYDMAEANYTMAAGTDEALKAAIKFQQAQGDLAKAQLLTKEAVDEQVQGIRDLHLSGIVANQTVATLIRYQLDWTKATELATIAQNSATFAAQDSSQAIQGLINGITTLQPRILRTYGLMINLDVAYEKYAKANNLVAEHLTVTERQQAALNEVLAQGPSIAGAYDAAMGTASKQLRSLKTDVTNVSEAFGEEYTPILDTAVGGTRSFLSALEGLPDPIQAAIGYAGGAASALTLLGGAALTAIGAISRLKLAMEGLGIASLGMVSAIGGIVTILAGVAGYVISTNKAHEDEALAILAATDNYRAYITKLDDAAISAYGLTEALYDLVKAQEASAQAAFAEELRKEIKTINRLIDLFNRADASATRFIDSLGGEDMSDFRLELLKDAEVVTIFGTRMGKSGEELHAFVKDVVAWATATETARINTRNYNRFEIERAKILRDMIRAQRDSIEGIEDEAAAISRLTTEIDGYSLAVQDAIRNDQIWRDAAKDAIRDLQAAIDYQKALADNAEDAAWAQIDAWHDRNQAFEDLDRDYGDKAADLWQEYAENVADAEADIAALHAGTLQELLDLDREYAQKREDAWRDYQQGIEDAERDFQQDLQDLNRERLQDIEDENRDYAQKQEDLLRDLNQDLEDDARDHARKMEEIERDRQKAILEAEEEYAEKLKDAAEDLHRDLEEMEYDHAQKLADIDKDYRDAQEAADADHAQRLAQIYQDYYEEIKAIREKYDPDQPAKSRDTQREDLLERIRWLRQMERRTSGTYGEQLEEQRIAAEKQLAKLRKAEEKEAKQRLSQALAQERARKKAEDEQRQKEYEERMAAEEERFQREMEERKQQYQEFLDALLKALGKEKDEIDEDAEEKRQKEEERYNEQREERQRRYEERLDDLARAHQRELEEIERQHQRELDELRRALEEEKQELADRYARRLEEIAREHDRERQLIQQKLEEQLQTAREKYDEGLKDLNKWYADQKRDITRNYEDQRKEIQYQLGQNNLKAAEEFGRLPDAFQPTWDRLVADARTKSAEMVQAIIDEINRLFAFLQMGSPSRLFMDMGENIIKGLEKGLPKDSGADLLTDAFNVEAMQANINAALGDINIAAALPRQQVMMPPSAMPYTSDSFTNNLTVTANYRKYESEASLRNTLAGLQQSMNALPRR